MKPAAQQEPRWLLQPLAPPACAVLHLTRMQAQAHETWTRIQGRKPWPHTCNALLSNTLLQCMPCLNCSGAGCPVRAGAQAPVEAGLGAASCERDNSARRHAGGVPCPHVAQGAELARWVQLLRACTNALGRLTLLLHGHAHTSNSRYREGLPCCVQNGVLDRCRRCPKPLRCQVWPGRQLGRGHANKRTRAQALASQTRCLALPGWQARLAEELALTWTAQPKSHQVSGYSLAPSKQGACAGQPALPQCMRAPHPRRSTSTTPCAQRGWLLRNCCTFGSLKASMSGTPHRCPC